MARSQRALSARHRTGAIALALAALAAACGREAAQRPVGARHVVIVTLDTLRADRVGAYGARDVATPHLDRLARQGALAVHAMSHVPLTRPAHVSLFTGLLPSQHGVRDNIAPAVVPDVPLLAETLRAAGFRTGAFVSSIVVGSHSGLARGFDTYDEDVAEGADAARFLNTAQRRGDETLARALAWLDTVGDERLFAWIHLYDPHDPYEPPEPYAARYAERPYDGEVAWTDELVGRLDAALERRGWRDQTLLVVTSDHGEGLGEHEETLHGFFVYQTTLAIPLLLRGPGVTPGARIEAVVGLADLYPTVLELAGVPAPPSARPAGRSLVPGLAGESLAERPLYAESLVPLLHFGWSDLRVVREGSWKYIQAPRPELYDLARDPGETRDLSGTAAARVAAMAGRLGAFLDEERDAPAATGAVSQELLEKLGALGYVGGTAPADTATPGADPKDKIAEFRIANAAMREGLQALQAGDPAGAAKRFRGLLDRGIASFEAHFYLGRALLELGRHGQAEPHFEEAARRSPGHAGAWEGVAICREQAGDADGAVEALRGGQRALPLDAALVRREAVIHRDQGRLPAAREAYERALPLAPDDPLLRVQLAEVLRDLGELPSAIARFEEAIALAPDEPSYWNGLGMVQGGAGRLADAERSFREAVARAPSSARYQYNLGLALLRLGRSDAARPYFEAARDLDPSFAPARERLAELPR